MAARRRLLNLGNDRGPAMADRPCQQDCSPSRALISTARTSTLTPCAYWRRNDAPDRQGITEIRHVTGYLAYWDALLQEHPNMLIDSCASGGRRNDLETLRRAVPLLRSDYIIEPVGNQCHTYALSFWMPFYGTGTGAIDPYLFRSVMCPSFHRLLRHAEQGRQLGPGPQAGWRMATGSRRACWATITR